jgi:hypothetical protein
MATKTVEMATRDPANAQRFVSEMVEVEIVRVNIRNRDRYARNGRTFSDVICGEVKFKLGEVKTLEISQALATELKKRRDPAWELTATSPTPVDDDDADDEEVEAEVDTAVKRRRRA